MTLSSNDSVQTVSYLETPLSRSQIEVLSSSEHRGHRHNIVAGLRLVGELDVEALESSLNALLARHDILRSSLKSGEEKPVMVVQKELQVSLVRIELSALAADAQQAEVAKRVAVEAERPLLPDTQPLIRVQLLRLQEQEHLLLLTLHPLVADVRSVRLLFNELAGLYEGGLTGNFASLHGSAPQYITVAQHQRDKKCDDRNSENVEFWREQLANLPDRLALPVDRSQALQETGGKGCFSFAIPVDLTKRLCGNDQDLYGTLLAAWAGLMYRYTGQEEFLMGTSIVTSIVTSLDSTEDAGIVGPLTDARVLRLGMNDTFTFAQWVTRVQEQVLEARAHAEIAWDQFSENYLGMNHFELAQVQYDLFDLRESLDWPNGLQADFLVYSNGYGQADVMLAAVATDQGLHATISYRTELFDVSTMERMAGHFLRLLEAALDNPDQPLVSLNYLSEQELHQLLVEWNNTTVPYGPKRLVHDWVADVAERSPDAWAVISADGRITYGELNRQANRLAHHLRNKFGVGPDVRVAQFMERSYHAIVGMLGVLKAGGVYVPIDPVHPDERVAFIIEDTGSPVVLTQTRLLDRLSDQVQTICLDACEADLAHESVDNPQSGVGFENGVYAIYTSGTTGLPKGVQLAHDSLYHLMEYVHHQYKVSSADRFSQLAGVGFDASMVEIWPALTSGAPLYIVDDETRLSPPDLQRYLLKNEITAGFLPTPLAEVLIALEWPEQAPFRLLTTGGAKLHHHPRPGLPFDLINIYGPTEATVFATDLLVPPTNDVEKVPTIGKAIHNVRVYVLDRRMQPVPIGVAGELHIAGIGVASGYLNRPELNAEKFVSDPFAQTPGARMYKTGDLVRYLANGELEFLGRIDQQVKIRGLRIELGEIEAVMGQHPAVREAVVLAKESKSGDPRLVGYLVAQAGETVDEANLREFMLKKLPDYMVPRVLMTLDAMPLTANGKVNLRALPEPTVGTQEPGAGEQPVTQVEQMLAGLWSQVLGVEQIGRHDHFFALGGHSLLGYRLVSAIRDTFDVELSLTQVFEVPILSDMARAVEMSGQEEQQVPLVASGLEGDLPLSFAQQRMWFLYQLEPDLPLYNLPFAYRVTGAFDLDVLEQSLNELIRRQASLRTVFPQVGREPVQRVLPEMTLQLAVADLTHLPESEREADMRHQMQEAGLQPFDLAEGPLFRAHVYKLGAEEYGVLLSMHHIVADGWSLGIFLREWLSLYSAFAAGQASPLPELSIQYPDFAKWQGEWLQGETLERQVEYWRQQMAGAPALLELPTDHPRPAVQSYRGARHNFLLPRDLADALVAESKAEGVTLFMTLLAAWSVLMHRYSRQEDVVIGSPIAGRTRPEIEGLIGFFVNTLALRVDLSGELTFRDLLKRVRDVSLGAFAHQDLPFEKLVEVLQPERNRSYAPLFQVVFALQEDQTDALQAPQLQIESLQMDTGTAKFDLLLEMTLTEQGLQGSLEYATDLFDESTIRRMENQLRLLLAAVAANPELPVSQIPLLSTAERDRLLFDWNRTERDFRGDSSIPQVIEEHAAQTPDAVAVVYENSSLTYAELNARANRLAHYLQKQGVGQETMVGLCVERSPELLISLLAILKAGGIYVPLDPNYPEERLRFMMEDTAISLMIVQKHLLPQLPAEGIQTILLEDVQAELVEESVDNLPAVTTSDSVAYVMYTSGSTGKPKGVLVRHSGIMRLVINPVGYTLNADEVMLQFATIAFDASTLEIWGALLNGAKLVVFPAHKPSLEELGRVIKEQGVTTLFLTTALFHQMVEHQIEDLRHVRQLLSGGDVMSVSHVQKVREQLPNCHLVNCYGPTENTTVTTCYAPATDNSNFSVPIGRPISNTQVYILDAHMQPVPIGVLGELYTGGAGLARGYWNRPELTAEKFVPNPFSDDPNARLYRTGDLVRYLPDGNIEFYGRIDDQVKIRGFRIELGEIETVLGQHPNLQEVVLLAREDVPGEKRLVAYLVPIPDTAPTVKELRDFLSDKLPEYMIPSAFILLEKIPVTPNGKVDRRALPAPQLIRDEGEYIPPQTPTEEMLAGLWSQLLHVEQVGRDDDFFALGGHSLLATQLVSAIRETFEVEMPLGRVFDATALSELAELIDGMGRGLQAPPIVPGELLGDHPLSFAQQRLWFLYQMDSMSALYNVPFPYRLTGALDLDVLERSLQVMIARHASLRTVFPQVGREPVQRVLPEMAVSLEKVDLSHFAQLPEDVRETELTQQMLEAAKLPFDLANGPLFRTHVYKMGADEYGLVFNMHHIVTDGWSFGIFLRELSTVYAALAEGQASPLAELPVQYPDYAKWQQAWLQGEMLEQQVDYWREQLAGAPTLLELPTDRRRPPVQSYRGARRSFTMPRELAQALLAHSHAEGVTLFMTLLSAWSVLLKRYSGQEEVVVGTPVAGRSRQEMEGLIGFFINTLALRVDLSGEPTFRELLKRVREVSLGAYAHQDLPFEKLVEVLQPERNRSYAPLFQVVFVMNSDQSDALCVPNVQVEPQFVTTDTSKFDLSLEMTNTEQGLVGTIEYSTDLFDESTILRMQEHLGVMLAAVADNPDLPIAEIPLLTEAEQQQVLNDWNRTEQDYRSESTIGQLFAEQAARTPDAVAVVFGNSSLTYAELNKRANQLAHHLQKQGVDHGTMVGLCVERSPELIVSLLAIVKAGGVFVPLDPNYPRERLRFMMEDTNLSLLVAQKHLLAQLPADGIQAILLEDVQDAMVEESTVEPLSTATAESLLYVMYTSGSTGKPKGVLVPQRGVMRLVIDADFMKLDAEEVLLQFAPVSFDASTLEIWGALLNGAKLVLYPAHKPSLEELGRVLQEQGVTTLWLTAALFHQMVEHHLEDLRNVRQLVAGGDVLSVNHVQKVLEQLPNCRLINGYGPTENTTFTTCYTITEVASDASVPIGRPIANTQVYILDPMRQPVPIGVPGELYVGGAGLANGYLNRPDLTEEKFVPNPFSADPNARLYRTGDLVRYLLGGNIEFCGRIDNQVKIRGFRIELGEIETVLGQHPDIQQVVLLAREDVPGEKRLVAYLVPEKDTEPTVKELRHFLSDKLPEYMVPSVFMLLEKMPVTPNGKVDRRALPKPQLLREKGQYIPPQTPTEELLASVWSQVLHVEQVGSQDDFFELGGHSLLATQLVSAIRETFEVEMALATLFDATTVAKLAAVIDSQARGVQAPPIVAGELVGDQPLSFAQQRLWFLHQMNPQSALYNVPIAFRLTGQLDVAALERSVEQLITRHASLRTVFPVVHNEPVQRVLPTMATPFTVLDATVVPEAEREVQANVWLQADAQGPFDLDAGPLVRVTLCVLGEQEHILLLNIHHIVTDGWSTNLLMRDLLALYDAECQGATAVLPELAVQYADFSKWQQEWLQGEVLDQQLAYWQKQLAGAPKVLELPTDKTRPPVLTYQGTQQEFLLSSSLTERLNAVSRAEGVTLFMTLLAAWMTLLQRYSNQEDLVVGVPIAGRNRQEVEGVVGFFVNTLAMRVNMSGLPTFRDLLKQVREVALGAYAHQDMPFEKLVEGLQLERNMSYSPIFQVMFVLQQDATYESLPGLNIETHSLDVGVSKFDISLEMMNTEHGLKGNLVYNTDLFAAETIARMIQHFQMVLEAAVTTPELPVAYLPVLTEPEREQLLHEWNATDVVFNEVHVLHRLIEEQVQRTPDATAVSYAGRSLTYRELNERANQLAHHLRQRGAGVGVLIGIAVERSIEMSVGLLGILKADSAYVPMDPTYPKDRLAYMLEDANVPVLLTQEHLLSALPEHQAHVICLDRDWHLIADENTETPDSVITPDDLAYMIYTSGSTGKPKGAMNNHRGICNSMLWMQSEYNLTVEDRVLQKTPFSFDVSIWELFWPLMTGAEIVMARPEGHKDSAYLVDVIQREQITTLAFVPSMLQMFLEEPAVEQCTSVKRVLAIGEALPYDLTERFHARMQAGLHNLYGPTEAAVQVTYWRCEREGSRRSVPIGYPIANTQMYVLNPHLQPVPIGVAGELHIGGVQVGVGYRNREELTAERFIPDPFRNEPSARLYKTGDLACYKADGTIEYLGRIDNQVKLRGLRIELGEIEAALTEHPAVREAVVIVKELAPGDQRMLAYFVAATTDVPEAGELKAFLGTTLPDYMVPDLLVEIAEMPLSPSGKADRKALLDLKVEMTTSQAEYAAPRTATETELAGMLSGLLSIESVGIYDNFFDLGANSLLLARMAIQMREKWQTDFNVRVLFEAPTVAELAVLVEEGLSRKDASPVVEFVEDIWDEAFEDEAFADENAELAEELLEGLSDEEVEALLRQLTEGNEADE